MQQRDVTISWNALLAERLRTRRTNEGWRQMDVAQRQTGQGIPWTRQTVAAIEARDRDVSVFELVALASLFGLGVRAFLTPNDDEAGYAFEECDPPARVEEVTLETPGIHVSLGNFLASIDGVSKFHFGISGGPRRLDWSESTAATDPMVVKMAGVLTVSPESVIAAAQSLWQKSPPQERDERLGETDGVPPRTVQARRGHITRTMTNELREELSR